MTNELVNESSRLAAPVVSTAAHSTRRGPTRSSARPNSGAANAASKPPSDTAPDIAVRDHPNESVIGSTNTDSVATAPPWREKPAQQAQNKMIQP